MHLRRVAEARADEHLAARGVPAGEPRGAELRVAPDLVGYPGGYRGHALDDEVVAGGDDGAVGLRERRGHEQDDGGEKPQSLVHD